MSASDLRMSCEVAFAYMVENEPHLHRAACWCIIAVGICVLLVELGLDARAPYGRHSSLPAAKWYGPTIPAPVAWCFQESWSVTVPFVVVLYTDAGACKGCVSSIRNKVLFCMFVVHYAYRTFGYPLQMHRTAARMPIGLCLLASAFIAFNGYVQSRAWARFEVLAIDSCASAMSTIFGVSLWLLGVLINLHSDATLRGLRSPGDSGYKVPKGGAFEYVSCANYFGEIVEWYDGSPVHVCIALMSPPRCDMSDVSDVMASS